MRSGIKESQAPAPSHVRLATSAFGNAYRFAGRRIDDQTGLYYNRHRYYDARSGRFLSRDPLGYIDGMNVYAALLNNPAGRRDPLGASIVVDGRNTFKKKVEKALCEICPCFDIDIEKGLVRAAPPTAGSKTSSCKKRLRNQPGRKREYRPGRESFYDCYCRHRAGCNLLLDLVKPEFGETTILEVKSRDQKRGNRHNANTGTVKYNPKRGESEGEDRPPSIGLAHELIHAHHYHTRRRTGDPYPGRTREEHRTVRAENQIRREMRGDFEEGSSRYRDLPMRTTYKGGRVENPEAGDLDVTNRFGDFELAGPGGPGWRPSRMGNWIPY